MKNQDKCATPNCRGSCDIRVLGQPMCWECWKKKCERDDREMMNEINKEISDKADVLGLSFMLRKKE